MTDGEETQAEWRRPRGLAGAHLELALDALGWAGDPDHLYPRSAREQVPTEEVHRTVLASQAYRRRGTYVRTAALFSALAAEAYVNEFLATKLSGRDLRAVDRLPTVEKYVVGCRLAFGEPIFERGHEPVQTIAAVFKLRDKLAHPKPGYGPRRYGDEGAGEIEADFTAAKAGRFVVCIAAAAVILVKRAYPEELLDIPATFIWHERNTVFAYVDRVSAGLPAFDAPAEAPLMSQLLFAAKDRSEQ